MSRPPRITTTVMDWKMASKVVTHKPSWWAIDTFSSFKSPGMNGIFPALLHKGMNIIIHPSAFAGLGIYTWELKGRTNCFYSKSGTYLLRSRQRCYIHQFNSLRVKVLERLVEGFIKDWLLAISQTIRLSSEQMCRHSATPNCL